MRRVLGLMALLLPCCIGQARAETAITLRDRVVVLSSASTTTLTRLLVRSFAERFAGVATPSIETVSASRMIEAFCQGVGPQTPDIAIVSRRMPRAVIDACNANGVRDIIEVRLGLGAVVLAGRRGDAAHGVSARQVWEALAAERPEDEEFTPNRQRYWSDIAPHLPQAEIRVLLPSEASGPRALFDDLVMEGGCRNVGRIRLIFDAAYRRSKCLAVRTDGHAVTLHGDEVVPALLAAPPGTLAVVSYDQLISSGGNLVALPLDGVAPNTTTIGNLDYEHARTFFLYAKRQHARNQQGVGVVRGIHEFLVESTSEQAAGPGGYLTTAGLVPLGPAERAAQRRIAEQGRLMSR